MLCLSEPAGTANLAYSKFSRLQRLPIRGEVQPFLIPTNTHSHLEVRHRTVVYITLAHFIAQESFVLMI